MASREYMPRIVARKSAAVETVYPFTEVPRAFEHLAKGPFGKIVIAGA
jgi:hypothetical protein